MLEKKETEERPLIIEESKLSPEEMESKIKSKKIGQIHYFLNGTDGVSLQAQETATYLNILGAETFSLAADTPDESETSSNSPELNYHSEEVADLRDRILNLNAGPDSPDFTQQQESLLQEINDGADVIYQQMIDFIESNGLDIAHIRNLSAMPFLHLQAAVAVDRVIQEKPEIRFILHHHDFYWEGPDGSLYVSKYDKINKLADKVTAPNFENTRHVCINTIAQEELKDRKKVDATFIPDGFDFEKEVEEMSEASERELLEKYGIKENDLVFALTTRTRRNKGYQTAIRIIRSLQDKRELLENSVVGRNSKIFDSESEIYLVVVQSADFDHEYYSEIEEYAQEMGVRLVYIGEDIVADAQYTDEDRSSGKHSFYSFTQSDIVDSVLYVATHEGWGNQAIEAAWAKIIIMMFGYPVAVKDILNNIEGIIQVGDSSDLEPWGETDLQVIREEVVGKSTDELIEVLLDRDLEEEMTEKAYDAFRELCHIQKIVEQYLDLYLN